MENQETSHIDVFEISGSVPDRDKAVLQFRDLSSCHSAVDSR